MRAEHQLVHILYSHKEYSDLWKPFLGEFRKYYSAKANIIGLCNQKIIGLDKTLIYNDEDLYHTRLLSGLTKLTNVDTIFLWHEDMILYDTVDLHRINSCRQMVFDGVCDCVRMIYAKHPFRNQIRRVNDDLVEIIQGWRFAVQPSIWRLDYLIELLRSVPRQLQYNGGPSGLENYFDFAGVPGTIYANFPVNAHMRGGLHYELSICPYIATAIVKGKWNMSEYTNELDNIFRNYDIDPFVRGVA